MREHAGGDRAKGDMEIRHCEGMDIPILTLMFIYNWSLSLIRLN